MGGAGTLYLGVKYASIWAAIGPIAPAAFGIEPDSLEKIKNMPVIFLMALPTRWFPLTFHANGLKRQRIKYDL